MTTFLLMLAAGVAVQGGADVAKSQPRKCGYTIQQVSGHSGSAKYQRGQNAPMKLQAVEKTIDGCPVLTEADTGRTFEPPVFSDGPARVAPAR